MPSILQSLRSRLVALTLLMFGLIQVGLLTLGLELSERMLRNGLDRRVIEEALALAAVDTSAQTESVGATSAGQFHLDPPLPQERYVQVRREDGAVRERSANLGEATLPLSLEARRSVTSSQPVLETLADFTSLRGEELRLVTVHQARPHTEPFFLQVAVSLAPVTNTISTLRRTFWTLIPLGLAAAGVAAWWLVRRSMAPIGEIVRKARDLTAERLDRRIEGVRGRDEVTELVVTVNRLLERLETTFKAQNRFIADAAHELKTPVTLLLGQAQVLSRKARTIEEYDQFVGSVQDETRHLAQIVESLLLLARADAGIPPDRFVRVSVNELVMDAVQRSTPYARQQESRLLPVLAPPDPDGPEPQIEGDPELLCAMVTNLIRNAILYSPPDTTVEVQVSLSNRIALITVRDRGRGIPEADLERVFDRFYRVPHPDGPCRGTGLGLGLSIARAAAHLHRGQITARRRPGGGSELVIHLPLQDPSLDSRD